jgi:topoisomerase-4 subunit A
VLRLNYDGRGEFLGEFQGTDLVLVVLKNGEYYTSTFDATNHYEDNILRIELFRPKTVWTAILNDADQGYPYIKRFRFEPTAKKMRWLGENPKSTLIALSDAAGARFEVKFGGGDSFREPLLVEATEFIAVKSLKAKGKRLTTYELDSVTELEPNIVESEENELNETMTDGNETSATAADDATSNDDNEEREPDLSDDEVRDAINGQERLF